MEPEGKHRNSIMKQRILAVFGLVEIVLRYDHERFSGSDDAAGSVINGRQPTASAEKRYIIKLNVVHNHMLYKEIEAVQANMLAEMLRAEAASAMEHCALPYRRLRIQILDIHSCGGEKIRILEPP
ncbi:hypothetical protein EVAR_74194_1 [Eumeta japonica]|uniref:Uncharacterized protein n=1 Tax=Eumeta variegata TaxID=151549 RepID=A0A4C1SCK9_EUMVA|nr:hypothetical protein EVAR_74194_1 [Eumeta japonica]